MTAVVCFFVCLVCACVVALEVWSQPVTASLLDRWCGELVKLVVMPTSIFVPNKTGKDTSHVFLQHSNGEGASLANLKLTIDFLLTGFILFSPSKA